MRKLVVGVMGPGGNATHEQEDAAYQIGELVACYGLTLLSGGMRGTMASACRGAKDNNGLVIGICPTDDKGDLNQWIDVPIVTGMKSGRNFINILSSDIVIAIGTTNAGTLSEIAFALQKEKPLLITGSTNEMQPFIRQVENGKAVYFADSIDEIKRFLSEQYFQITNSILFKK